MTKILIDDAVVRQALEALKDFNYEGACEKEIAALRQALERPTQTKTPLSVLNLTVRAEHILKRGRVYDVETLRNMDARDILAIPDAGKKTLSEINIALLEYEHTTEQKRLADAALDKMAENARELGLSYEQPDRQALQAAGIHPAPCARHCEANAFEIAARGMRKQIAELQEALDSMRGRHVAQIDTLAERVEKEAGNKHVCPPNCGTGFCSCVECLFEQPAPAQPDHFPDATKKVERMAWVYDTGKGYKMVGYSSEAIAHLEHGTLLFPRTTPPAPAQPLTQKEVVSVFNAGVRFAEAAHGITKGTP